MPPTSRVAETTERRSVAARSTSARSETIGAPSPAMVTARAGKMPSTSRLVTRAPRSSGPSRSSPTGTGTVLGSGPLRCGSGGISFSSTRSSSSSARISHPCSTPASIIARSSSTLPRPRRWPGMNESGAVVMRTVKHRPLTNYREWRDINGNPCFDVANRHERRPWPVLEPWCRGRGVTMAGAGATEPLRSWPQAPLQRPQHRLDTGLQRQILQHGQQLPLLVPEVRLHDRGDALQMPVQLSRGAGLVHALVQLGDQVRHHRVVLLEVAQCVPKVRVLRSDRRKQVAVLGAVVPIERSAEPVAEQQQVTTCHVGAAPRSHCLAGDLQRLAQPTVHGAQLLAPGDQPGRLALSHVRAKGKTTSCLSFVSGASMPDIQLPPARDAAVMVARPPRS